MSAEEARRCDEPPVFTAEEKVTYLHRRLIQERDENVRLREALVRFEGADATALMDATRTWRERLRAAEKGNRRLAVELACAYEEIKRLAIELAEFKGIGETHQ